MKYFYLLITNLTMFRKTVLPSQVLPSNALRLISEYSKPLTRPNWRKSKPIINTYTLFLTVYIRADKSLLHYLIYCNIRDREWFEQYWYIRRYGVHYCCLKYGITIDDIIRLGLVFIIN
uniref:Uncharacterized protein n=1 Tax=viral metagenome TaxID=1070528 RepID=A0A6C0JLC3_9ZZZZ